jgi:putative endonuclease
MRRPSGRPTPSRSRRRLGPEAERRVRRHYRLRGYRILAANARAGGYELDIVVRRGRTVTVCEVKARSGAEYGAPVEAVGPEKVRRVRRAAEAWLARRPELAGLDVRLEAVAVSGRRIERVPFDW